MRQVTPKVFCIGATEVKKENAREWLDHIGAQNYVLEDNVTGAEQLTQLAGKRCYMSFVPGLNPNVQRVRTDMAAFLTNILEVGHGSVMTHAWYSWAIEGVSRVFTGEMNRHSAGTAISEGSMRFIRFEDIPWVRTPILELENYAKDDPIRKKVLATLDLFNKAFSQDEANYKVFCEIWAEELEPKSKFFGKKTITSLGRRIIGMGVATGGVWSGNIRALRHIYTMRCDEVAEEEILQVASLCLVAMKKYEPLLFKDFELDSKGFWRPKYYKV